MAVPGEEDGVAVDDGGIVDVCSILLVVLRYKVGWDSRHKVIQMVLNPGELVAWKDRGDIAQTPEGVDIVEALLIGEGAPVSGQRHTHSK